MNVIEKILELFDELDAFESVELQEELTKRGYELRLSSQILDTKIKKNKESSYGLFLSNYTEDMKIAAIKTVKNLTDHFSDIIDGGMQNLGLKETKDFCEKEKYWNDWPIVFGKKEKLEKIKYKVENEYQSRVVFNIKIIKKENFKNKKLYDPNREKNDNCLLETVEESNFELKENNFNNMKNIFDLWSKNIVPHNLDIEIKYPNDVVKIKYPNSVCENH